VPGSPAARRRAAVTATMAPAPAAQERAPTAAPAAGTASDCASTRQREPAPRSWPRPFYSASLRTSDNGPRTSGLGPRTSGVGRRTSDVGYRSSVIGIGYTPGDANRSGHEFLRPPPRAVD